jgi:hypothetical protein
MEHEDQDEVRAAITRRGIAYTYQSLEERYEAAPLAAGKKDRRLGIFKDTTAEGQGGIEVLKHKLEELAIKVFLNESDDIIFEYLAYVMAALAGQPGKEVLVINSKEAAAHVSYHLMRYLGFRLRVQVADTPKKQKRTYYYPVWLTLIMECERLAGINQVFEDRLAKHWVQTGKRSDAGLALIQKEYADRKWCKNYAMGLKSV